jgi:hypothetical protein
MVSGPAGTCGSKLGEGTADGDGEGDEDGDEDGFGCSEGGGDTKTHGAVDG